MKEDNRNILELKYIDQRNEALEAWIRKDKGDWVRLDFMLEYYLTRDVNLSRHYKGHLNDETVAKRYYSLLYTKFADYTLGGLNFDFPKYLAWQKSNHSEISKAIELMNAPN